MHEPSEDVQVGQVIGPVPIGRIAHGGHWVARHEGRVFFARGVLEGETATLTVTKVAKRHAFADVAEVLDRSPHRVDDGCPIAADCGGCDFQHVTADHQRELKRQVVAEQLGRLAGLTWEGHVEQIEPTDGWRTRVRYHRGPDGWGMHPQRSNAVTPLPAEGCRIAVPELRRPPADLPGDDVPGNEVLGVRSADGTRWCAPRASELVTERAAGRTFGVRADGFWQVHPAAADTLVAAVLDGLQPTAGETALDLYCGVGLFAGALEAAGLRVTGVEGSKPATALAQRNVPGASFVAGSMERVLGRAPQRADVVVLDPPRTGAGAAVLAALFGRRPRAIAYVACDPAALARDLATAQGAGWTVASVRAFDLFPATHHVECVAILTPGAEVGR